MLLICGSLLFIACSKGNSAGNGYGNNTNNNNQIPLASSPSGPRDIATYIPPVINFLSGIASELKCPLQWNRQAQDVFQQISSLHDAATQAQSRYARTPCVYPTCGAPAKHSTLQCHTIVGDLVRALGFTLPPSGRLYANNGRGGRGGRGGNRNGNRGGRGGSQNGGRQGNQGGNTQGTGGQQKRDHDGNVRPKNS